MSARDFRIVVLVGLVAALPGCLPDCGAQKPVVKTEVEDESVGDVFVHAVRKGSEVTLNVSTYAVEGDWTYPDFHGARLDNLSLTTQDGVAVHVGPARFTPTSEGGQLEMAVLDLPPGESKLFIKGRFVVLNEDGSAYWTLPLDQSWPIRFEDLTPRSPPPDGAP